MIVFRRLCHRKRLDSGFQWLCPWASPSSQPAKPPFPAVPELKRPCLGFFPQSASSRVIKPSDRLSLHYFFNAYCSTSHAAVSVGGMVEVPLAQTGEGIAECELLKWFVQEGEQVEEFQPLCEVQSDKATIEITSRYKGKISHILHAPGDIVKVGETLLKMVVEEFSSSTVSDGLSNPEFSDSSIQGDSNNEASSMNENRSSGVLCTPAFRNLAKQHGIDLNDIRGSGKDGRILKEDILNCVSGKDIDIKSSASFDCSPVAETLHYEDKTLQLRGFQRAMIKSMTMAARIPHFHYVEEMNCDALVELKASFQNENSDPSIKHTFLPFLVKSLSMALSKYPLLNSCFNEDMNEIIVKGSHNIGIAMATPYGLVVPNIKKVQCLSILEITKEASRLQQLAMDNKLGPDDITGGTITISNIGAIGGKFGSPLINLPEVAIIAIGIMQKVAHITDDGTVYPRPVMNVCGKSGLKRQYVVVGNSSPHFLIPSVQVNIGADHRVLDGATVARFCNEWKSFIENPEQLLLHMR